MDRWSNFALVGTPNGSSLLGEGGFGQVFKAIHFPTMRYQICIYKEGKRDRIYICRWTDG
jgi:hypothetical protein